MEDAKFNAAKLSAIIRENVTGKRIFFGLLFVIRSILFYVMLWMRAPIVMLAGALSSLAAVAFLIMLVLRGWSAGFHDCWPMLALSFGGFMLKWVYDGVLMVLSPEPLLMDI